MKFVKIPRIGIQLSGTVYIPLVKSFVPVKAFETNLYKIVVYKDCEGLDAEYQYLYIMFVYHRDGDRIPCFAVSASTNALIQKLQEAGQALAGSYTLGVFPCDGQTRHLNFGISDEWADLDKFVAKALLILCKHLPVSETSAEVPVPEQMRKRLAFAKEVSESTDQRKKSWWKFWKI